MVVRRKRNAIEVMLAQEWAINSTEQWLYIPWIREHGDALVNLLEQAGLEVAPIRIMPKAQKKEDRLALIRFVRRYPDLWRQALRERLESVPPVKGILLTLDWLAVFHEFVHVAKEIGILTVLVPHEGLFFSEEKYYTDPVTGANVPITDYVLAWGQIQREIFVSRGYPDDRVWEVGAPKFDAYASLALNSRSDVSQQKESAPILFAAQPMDNARSPKDALLLQNKWLKILVRWAALKGRPLILRAPPATPVGPVFDDSLLKLIKTTSGVTIDKPPYIQPPQIAIASSSAIISMGSTMLVEGLIAGRSVIVLDSPDKADFWNQLAVFPVRSIPELESRLTQGVSEQEALHSVEQIRKLLVAGVQDGLGAKRVVKALQLVENLFATDKNVPAEGFGRGVNG